jgi:hypothetical protein
MKKVILVTVSYYGTSLLLPSTYEDGKAWYAFFSSIGIPSSDIVWMAENDSNPQVSKPPTRDNIV